MATRAEKRVDVYEIVTERIIKLLEAGTVPWQKPWSGEDGMPRNLKSKKEYRGVNVWLLACAGGTPWWLTFKQAREMGGSVRKGEKGMPVVFWNWVEREDEETGKKKRVGFLRYYTVFNADQCDGIEVPAAAEEGETREHKPIKACEKVIKGWKGKPPVHHDGGNRAFYRPSMDSIHLPKPEKFESPEHYYSTLFHECTHSTGHKTRLARPGITDPSMFGSHAYSKEELVAEMGAAYLAGQTGISVHTEAQSAAYIKGWLSKLRGDSKLVVQAAGMAQRAVDLILGRKFEQEGE